MLPITSLSNVPHVATDTFNMSCKHVSLVYSLLKCRIDDHRRRWFRAGLPCYWHTFQSAIWHFYHVSVLENPNMVSPLSLVAENQDSGPRTCSFGELKTLNCPWAWMWAQMIVGLCYSVATCPGYILPSTHVSWDHIQTTPTTLNRRLKIMDE